MLKLVGLLLLLESSLSQINNVPGVIPQNGDFTITNDNGYQNCEYYTQYYPEGTATNTKLCRCRGNSTLDDNIQNCDVIEERWNVTSSVTGHNPYGNASDVNTIPWDLMVEACPNIRQAGCENAGWDGVVFQQYLDNDPTDQKFIACGCPYCICDLPEVNRTLQGYPYRFTLTEPDNGYDSYSQNCYRSECVSSLAFVEGANYWQDSLWFTGSTPSSIRNIEQWCDWSYYYPPTASVSTAFWCEIGDINFRFSQLDTPATWTDGDMTDRSTHCQFQEVVAVDPIETQTKDFYYKEICRDDTFNLEYGQASSNDLWGFGQRGRGGWGSETSGSWSWSGWDSGYGAAAFGEGLWTSDVTLELYAYDCLKDDWVTNTYVFAVYAQYCNTDHCNNGTVEDIHLNAEYNSKLGTYYSEHFECQLKIQNNFLSNKFSPSADAGQPWYLNDKELSRYAGRCATNQTKAQIVQPCDRLREEKEKLECFCRPYQTFAGMIGDNQIAEQLEYDFYCDNGYDLSLYYKNGRELLNKWIKYYDCSVGELGPCDLTSRVNGGTTCDTSNPSNNEISASNSFNTFILLIVTFVAYIVIH